MYFDLDDRGWDIGSINRALSWREGILVSIILHLVLILAIVLKPDWPLPGMTPEEIAQQVELKRQRERDATQRFVFVQPRLDMEAPKPPPTPDLSDKDRMARAPERALEPLNRLPFSRGNTRERVDIPGLAAPPPPQAEGQPGADPDDGSDKAEPGSEGDGGGSSLILPGPAEAAAKGSGSRPGGLHGTIGEALRNLQRYTQGELFENPQGGGGAYGPAIQFDTKGVEFGPWVRRFVAQVKRNWFIPYAAMSFRGHVVITFNVHKDGTITDLTLAGPCDVSAFNNAAFNALAASNPTYPLPPEYPATHAFFTVTFYYNEDPPR